MRLSASIIIGAGLTVTVGLLVSTGLASYFCITAYIGATESSKQTLAALATVERALKILDNIQANRRDYLTIGGGSSLSSYRSSLRELRKEIEILTSLSPDSPGLQARLGTFQLLIEDRLAASNPFVPPRAPVVGLEAALHDISHEEQALLQWQEGNVRIKADRTLLLDAFGSLLAVGSLTAAGLLFRRDVIQRTRAETALARVQAETEVRVQARTAELVLANQLLDHALEEKKRAGEALREAEQRYRTLFEQAPDSVVLIDPETTAVVEFNELACRQLGYTREEFARLRVPDFEAIETPAETTQRVEQLIAAGRLEFETQHRAKDGSLRSAVVCACIVELAGKRYIQSIFRDITDRKRADELLRASEERFRTLYDDNPVMYFTLAEDGTVLSVNRFGARQLGYAPEELTGRSVLEVFHEDDKTAVSQALASYLESPMQVDSWEFRKVRKDGGVLWVQEHVRTVQTADGNRMVLVVCEDITERKRAEEVLRHSQASLANAQRIARLGNWDWDIATNELRWSDEIYLIFGLAPQEFGATYEAFLHSVHPDDRASVRRSVDDALFRKLPYSIDHRILLPDGTERIVHEQAEVTCDSGGTPLWMAGTVQDITERKKAEDQLRRLHAELAARVQELEDNRSWLRALAVSSNEMREQTAKRIAHELHDEAGQLLAAIQIEVDSVLTNLQPPEQVRLRNVKDLVAEVTARFRGLAHELRPTMLDDLGLIPALEFLAQGFLNRRGIRVTITGSTEERLAPSIETVLYRVVQEAMTNVAKHAKATEVAITIVRDSEELTCCIKDNGLGFDPAAVGCGKEHQGLGLLSIRERVSAVGGSFELTSRIGQGTELCVHIPLSGA